MNKLYGMYYHRRSDIFNDFRVSVASEVKKQNIKPFKEYPLHFTYTFYFMKKPLDIINCSGMIKVIEDSLRYCKILENDDLKFVKGITILQEKSEEKYDYVIIKK
jgi:hypothetical protein